MKNDSVSQSSASWKRSFTSRQFRSGSLAVIITAVVIVVLVAVNLVVGALPSNLTSFDMTSQGLYSLGDSTKELVKNLQSDVTIYYMTSPSQKNDTISNTLDSYAALSDKLTVVEKDPVVYPNFASQYTDQQLAQNSLIVVSGDRSTVVAYDDIFVTSYSMDQTTYQYVTNTTYDGENAITSAIDYVTSATLPKVYYITGHGEPGFEDTLTKTLTKKNITVTELSLLSVDAIPEDADCLVLDAPTKDLSDDEVKMILDYLDKGGRLAAFVGDGTKNVDTPNLDKIAAEYGIVTVKGCVLDSDRNHYYQQPCYVLPDIKAHDITNDIISGGIPVLAAYAEGVTVDANVRSTVTVTPLLATSDSAVSRQNLTSANINTKSVDGDIAGPFYLGAAAVEPNDGAEETRVVWYSAASLPVSGYDVTGANSSLVVSTLGWLTGHDSAISIDSKSLSNDTIVLTTAQASWWSTVYCVLIPLLCIGIGVFIFIQRRRNK